MVIEPIGPFNGFSPVLVIDRGQQLGGEVIRVAEASELTGQLSVSRGGVPTSSLSSRGGVNDTAEEKAITSRIGYRLAAEASVPNGFAVEPLAISSKQATERFQTLVLLGSMELDLYV